MTAGRIIRFFLRLVAYPLLLFFVGSYAAGKLGYLETEKSTTLSDTISESEVDSIRSLLLDSALICRKMSARLGENGTKNCYHNYAYYERVQDENMSRLAQKFEPYLQSVILPIRQLHDPQIMFAYNSEDSRSIEIAKKKLRDLKAQHDKFKEYLLKSLNRAMEQYLDNPDTPTLNSLEFTFPSEADVMSAQYEETTCFISGLNSDFDGIDEKKKQLVASMEDKINEYPAPLKKCVKDHLEKYVNWRDKIKSFFTSK